MLRTSPNPYRPEDEANADVFLPVPEVAAILRTTERTIRRHVRAGQLEAVTVTVAANLDGELLVTTEPLPSSFRELCTRTCVPADQVARFLVTQGAPR